MASQRLMKTKWFPQPHRTNYAFYLDVETAEKQATIIPLCSYDEGEGDPSARETNPLHASFALAGHPNCFPESEIQSIFSNLTFSLTKGALETDKIHALLVGFMPITMSFKEDYIAIDELSQIETQDVLELETESTDRQGFPLWNETKLTEKYAGSGTFDAKVNGLTTTQIIEGVDFQEDPFYNMIQFLSNGGKLKNLQSGMKYMVLTKTNPVKQIKLKISSKVKRMNPYTFFGVMVYAPSVGRERQFPAAGDVTGISHVLVQSLTRFNEWNQDFNFKFV